MRGTYYDGDSAKAHEVDVQVAENGLRLTGDGVDVTWSYEGLTRVGDVRRRDRLRLAPGPEREERLVIKGGAAADRRALAARAPHLFDLSRHHARMRRVVVSLTAAAAAIALFVFVILPAMSGPLARVSPPEWEVGLGESVAGYMDMFTEPCSADAEAQAAVDRLGARLAEQADLQFDLSITLVEAEFPNAMAMPAGRIVVTDQLLDLMDSPDELAGVLAHEIAHVDRRHVMASLMRDLGFSLVVGSIVGGGTGAGGDIIAFGGEAAALGHSRAAEREADTLALDYLDGAGLDPGGLASFFDTIALISGDDLTQGDAFAELLVTHPNAAQRADDARGRAKPERPPAMTATEWNAVLSACGLQQTEERDLGDETDADTPDEEPAADDGDTMVDDMADQPEIDPTTP